MNQTNKQLYWCDFCSSKKLDMENDKEYNCFFSCYTTQQYTKHLKTNKHLENKKNIEEDSESIFCKNCNKKYSKEGYEVHKKRNERWWSLGKINKISCNNFNKNTHRFSSFQELLNWDNKPKQSRTKVGSFSPITQSYRPPNGYNKEVEKELIVCDICCGALFTSYMDTKFLTKHETYICSCSDGDKVKQEAKYEKKDYSSSSSEEEELDAETIKNKMTKGWDIRDPKTKKYKWKENPDYDEDVNGATIKNKIVMDENNDIEWETERPKFDEFCDTCGYGVNYTYPSKIIERWDIDTCSCPDSDDTDSD